MLRTETRGLSRERIEEILRDPTGTMFNDLESKAERNQVVAALREQFAIRMRLYLSNPDNPRGRAHRNEARNAVLREIEALEGPDQILFPWMKSPRTHPAQRDAQLHSVLDRAVGPFLAGHSAFVE